VGTVNGQQHHGGYCGPNGVYTGEQMTWEEAFNSPWKAGPDKRSLHMEPPVKANPDGTYPVPVPGVTQRK
jgi:hypothetical protein